MKKVLSLAILVPAVALVVPQSAGAVPPVTKKVTICHRTHSVTNPYVKITVAESAIGNGASKHGGVKHDQYSSVLFPGGKPNPNVFNSSVTYSPATEKKWGDIIPNVYTDNSAFTAQGAGTNFTGIGVDIYNGTNGKSGICKAMNARDFYEVEKANGVATQDILDDLEESKDSDEFASALSACGGSFTTCTDSTKLGATSITIDTTTTTVAATTTTVKGATTTTVKGATTATTATTVAATRKLKGTLWIDTNRDGKKDTAEKVLANYTVTVKAGSGNSSTQTYTVTTDSAGNYEVDNIPAGNWIVTPAALPSANYEKVFDTDSNTTAADWVVTASVPATGEATADFATALSAAALASGATDTLGAVAVAPTTTVALAASTSSDTASASIPQTGFGSSGLVVLLATISGAIGMALLQIRRRRLNA